ncbi:uncharacterized protein AAG666_016841 [Megaptera novaeangliae]
MMQEEGLRRAVQEWRRLSNLDRMIYYEMAEKFMEFAAEEEMHIQHLQCMQCAQDLPPPAPPKLDPQGPPAPKVHLQPGTQVPTGAEGTACAPRMSGPRAQPSHPKPHRSQRTPEPKAPKEIPPETLREPLLAKDAHSLFFLSEVEAVIHPRFPAELFSPDPQLDLLALAEELEQEEGLTAEELVQKQLLDLKEDEGGPAAPSHSAPGMGSSPSESHAGQGAQRHDQDRHRGVSDEACPPEIDVEALHRPIRTVFRDFVPSRGRQAGKGGWTPGFPPQAPPPAAQLAPIVSPVNSGPWPHGTSREGRLATNQSNASQDGSSNPQKEYSNFRRWQLFKPLARRHFRLSPDAEAFSCFLIPVLRSVDRLKPTMMQEEGLRRAVQEWRRLSNLDRMIYYEMAEKFMEFAAEEEMHIQSLQWMQCAQDLPPPAPPKLDPRGPPAPKVHLQPGTQVPTGAEGTACAPRMSGPRAQPSHPKPHRSQRTPEPKAPKEIPPETVREPLLAKDAHSLFFLSEVEAVIHPRFLAELFSPDPQLDLLALAEELKQEEGLTPEELVQKQLLDLKEDEGGPAAPSHSAPGMGSSPSESHAGQGAQRHDQDRHRGVSDEACPPEIDVEALHRPIRTVFRDFVPSRGRQAGKGGWTPGFPPQAPPPAAQLAPIVSPVNSGPWPHGTSREGRLATNQSNASQDGSSNPQKEYSNFRRWQLFKPLARRHFRLSPDAEAFSCFLIPVLRSVDRLKPTMMQEEGLRRAVQEWRRLSNLDRMIYYEMAEKFMEFAAEEEMHIQSLQWMQCAQDLPPPAPPKLDPRGPPAPKVHLQPGTQVPTGAEGTACAPRMSGPRAQPSHPKPHRSQRTPEPKAPKEIPPETVREYVDRMEALVGPVHSARGWLL